MVILVQTGASTAAPGKAQVSFSPTWLEEDGCWTTGTLTILQHLFLMPRTLTHPSPPGMSWRTITGWPGGSRANMGPWIIYHDLPAGNCSAHGRAYSSSSIGIYYWCPETHVAQRWSEGTAVLLQHQVFASSHLSTGQCELHNETITLSLWDVKPLVCTHLLHRSHHTQDPQNCV